MEAAEEWGHEAGEFALRYYGHRVQFEDKMDGTPVTVADRGAEKLLRERINLRFPDHAVLGEEYGETNPGARVRWVLDPVDATRAFTRGVPIFGVLIGIEVAGEPVVGVSNFPAMREIVVAGRGLGCRWNGDLCHVSDTERVEDSLVLTTDVERVLKRPEGPGYRRIQQRALFARTWGDCYGHCLVATGRAEIMVDPVMASWDAGPFPTILTEAGGTFTTIGGERTMHGKSGVSTNGRLHDEVLKELATP
ncbi:MAG: histidinol phosphate phosphatase [Gemmatimonadetes bacterium]|nr:histidinol phosphate phosphatase [Gemmatimonadota bacterium]